MFDIVIKTIKNQGIQFAGELAKNPEFKDISVLYITALDEKDVADYLPPEAWTNVLHKPLDFNQLIAKIRQILAK